MYVPVTRAEINEIFLSLPLRSFSTYVVVVGVFFLSGSADYLLLRVNSFGLLLFLSSKL